MSAAALLVLELRSLRSSAPYWALQAVLDYPVDFASTLTELRRLGLVEVHPPRPGWEPDEAIIKLAKALR